MGDIVSAAAPIVGGIVGGPTGAAIGGGIASLVGGQRQADATQAAAQQAAAAAKFDPYNVYAQGIGGATFDDKGELNISLDPRMEQFRQGLLRGAGQPSPLFSQVGNLYGNVAQNIMGQARGFGQVGQGVVGLGRDVAGAGAGLFGQGRTMLGQAAGLSPTDIASQQYDITRGLIEPEQARQRSSLEQRLFAQGRLGSSGGAQQFGRLLESQGQQRNQLLSQALGQGLATQGQLFGQGLQTIGAGQGMLGLGTQQIGQGIGIGQQGAQQLGTGAQLFGSRLGLEQQMLDRKLQQLQAARSMAQDPLQLANMGIGIGGRQAAAGASTAPMLFEAGQADPLGTALMGFGQSIASSPGLFSSGPTTPVTTDYSGGGVAPGGSFGYDPYAGTGFGYDF
jgi:hypothetical protein